MKKISLLFIVMVGLLSSAKANAQNDIERLNYFKYVVIPLQYKFQKSENEYLLNSLTKHLFNEEGFETYMDVETKPKELTFNRCLAVYANIVSESESMFSFNTKLKLILKDCTGDIIFSTKGYSKIKAHKESYQDALRDAFEAFNSFSYAYNGKNNYDAANQYIKEMKTTANLPERLDKEEFKKVAKKDDAPEPLLEGEFEYNNTSYEMRKIEAGFILSNKITGEREAFINKTSNNSILYNSETVNGTLTVNDDNNLVVEYFNKESGALEKIVFKRVD